MLIVFQRWVSFQKVKNIKYELIKNCENVIRCVLGSDIGTMNTLDHDQWTTV